MKRYHTGFASLIRYYGEDRALHLTLTFPDNITELCEASRFWHSISTNLVNKKYPVWLRVAERTEQMRWHFHVLVFSEQPLVGRMLKVEQAFWREKALLFHFGRTEIKPVWNWKGLRHYLKKDFQHRMPCNRGLRLVTASSLARKVMDGKGPNSK